LVTGHRGGDRGAGGAQVGSGKGGVDHRKTGTGISGPIVADDAIAGLSARREKTTANPLPRGNLLISVFPVRAMSLRLHCDALTTCVLMAALLSPARPSVTTQPDGVPSHACAVDRRRATHLLPATCPVGQHPESGSRYHGDAAAAWSGCIADGTYRDADGRLRRLPAATATPPPPAA
jgi:hypothetical protein